jgi:carbon storage regulator
LLILCRRPNEIIRIGDDILIRVIEVHGQQVRIGIEAPRTLRVDREEIRNRILAQRSAPGTEGKQ